MKGTKTKGNFILYSPNVHSGGGLVLLQEFLKINGSKVGNAFVSKKAKDKLQLPIATNVINVDGSLCSRIGAEWRLKQLCRTQDTTLCFHGVPPLFSLPGKVIIFAQNRLLFEKGSLQHFNFKTRLRLHLERFWIKLRHNPSHKYIVQTPSMASALRQCFGKEFPLSILPFASQEFAGKSNKSKDYDFIYVASGEPHKNHLNLIHAWIILAEQGVKPSLALTIEPQIFPSLLTKVEEAKRSHGLNITNLEPISRESVKTLYASSGALIYPSFIESLGLPLIEAVGWGLPILASEKDFVRDSVAPDETFDPSSPLSIARAVRRFIKAPESCPPIRSAADFLQEVIK